MSFLNRLMLTLWIHRPQVPPRSLLMMRIGLILFALGASPLLAQTALPSSTDNAIVNTAKWFTQMALWVGGGLLIMWSALVAAMKNIFESERFQGRSTVKPLIWGAVVLAGPALAALFLEWWSGQPGVDGALDDVTLDLSLEP